MTLFRVPSINCEFDTLIGRMLQSGKKDYLAFYLILEFLFWAWNETYSDSLLTALVSL